MFRRDILKELVKWKDKKFRKPLVIRGARQVGKTTAIHKRVYSTFKRLVYRKKFKFITFVITL